jgi:hypothetical protein
VRVSREDYDSDATRLCDAILDLLETDIPCGFDEPDVRTSAALPGCNGPAIFLGDQFGHARLWPDDAQAFAVMILRARDRALASE